MYIRLSDYEIEDAIIQYLANEMKIKPKKMKDSYKELYFNKMIKKGISINHIEDLELEIFIETFK